MEASAAQTRPQKGQKLELQVDDLAFGGAGVARHDGYVVFVRDALPGDRVRAEITKRKRAYAEARTLEVVTPGPDRIAPVADHPGAPWQVLPYERQLEYKQRQVGEALTRLGKLEGFELHDIVPAVEQWRYRNKLEYSFGHGEDGELVCGFHRAGAWEHIEPLDDCLLASERGNAARVAALEWCRAQGLSAYDRRSQLGLLRNLVVREGRRTGELQVRLVTSDDSELDLTGFAESLDAESVLWTRAAGVAETTVGGLTEVLDGIAIDAAGLQGWERVYDLFCGIGTIGLSMAARAGEVWGLEIVESAIADAIANAAANEVPNARFFAGDVRLALRELGEQAGRPDVVVLDPPRAGLSAKIVRRIIESGPKRIVYVSCNPTTLAPNAAQLGEAGYTLRSVQPVDMFPQTPHIECVALLERG